jgi:hypothetical protein
MSCQKEDDIITPITETNNTTVNSVDTIFNGLDTIINNLPVTYKLVKCTYDYIDYNDQSNNISFFGNPYDEYGTTTDFMNDCCVDTLMINMPVYPVYYPNATEPLYYNGEPEWFILIINHGFFVDGGSPIGQGGEFVDITFDMRRVLCPATIPNMTIRFFITENNGVVTLTLSDSGNNWVTTQTMRFEPM